MVIIHTKFQVHYMFETEVRWSGHFVPFFHTMNSGTPALTGLCSDDDIIKQSIDTIETDAYAMNNYLVCKREEIRYNNIIKQYKNV